MAAFGPEPRREPVDCGARLAAMTTQDSRAAGARPVRAPRGTELSTAAAGSRKPRCGC